MHELVLWDAGGGRGGPREVRLVASATVALTAALLRARSTRFKHHIRSHLEELSGQQPGAVLLFRGLRSVRRAIQVPCRIHN